MISVFWPVQGQLIKNVLPKTEEVDRVFLTAKNTKVRKEVHGEYLMKSSEGALCNSQGFQPLD